MAARELQQGWGQGRGRAGDAPTRKASAVGLASASAGLASSALVVSDADLIAEVGDQQQLLVVSSERTAGFDALGSSPPMAVPVPPSVSPSSSGGRISPPMPVYPALRPFAAGGGRDEFKSVRRHSDYDGLRARRFSMLDAGQRTLSTYDGLVEDDDNDEDADDFANHGVNDGNVGDVGNEKGNIKEQEAQVQVQTQTQVATSAGSFDEDVVPPLVRQEVVAAGFLRRTVSLKMSLDGLNRQRSGSTSTRSSDGDGDGDGDGDSCASGLSSAERLVVAEAEKVGQLRPETRSTLAKALSGEAASVGEFEAKAAKPPKRRSRARSRARSRNKPPTALGHAAYTASALSTSLHRRRHTAGADPMSVTSSPLVCDFADAALEVHASLAPPEALQRKWANSALLGS